MKAIRCLKKSYITFFRLPNRNSIEGWWIQCVQ